MYKFFSEIDYFYELRYQHLLLVTHVGWEKRWQDGFCSTSLTVSLHKDCFCVQESLCNASESYPGSSFYCHIAKVVAWTENDTSKYKTPREHVKHIVKIFRLRHKVEITLKLKVYHFSLVPYERWGHVIDFEKLKLVKRTTNVIEALLYPEDMFQLRLFSEMCGG